MCGLNYCGPCSNPRIIAWGDGKTHDVPIKFGDGDQQRVACTTRMFVMQTMHANGEHEALRAFPEWQWAIGESHYLPKFGNSLMREQLTARRRRVIIGLYGEGRIDQLAAFPEWQVALRLKQVRSDWTSMSDVLNQLPHRRQKPMGSGRRNVLRRKKYFAWLERWQAPQGGAYHNLLTQMMQLTGQSTQHHDRVNEVIVEEIRELAIA